MTGMAYWGALAAMGIMAFYFFQNNNMRMAVLALIIGALIVYSHETGKGAESFKKGLHDTIDNPAKAYERKYDSKAFQTDHNITYEK